MGETIINLRDTNIIPPDAQERFLNLSSPSAKPLADKRIYLAGISDLCPGYDIRRYNIFHHLLLYTLSGTGLFLSSPTPRVLHADDLLIAPAGSSYSYRIEGDSWRIMWFHFESEAPLGSHAGDQIEIRQSYLIHNLYHATEGYLSESLRDDHNSRRAAWLYAELIAHSIDRELEADEDAHVRHINERFYQLWNKVNANLQTDWTVAGLALQMHMSAGHFHRLCLKYAGLSPIQMVTKLRMQRAEELLKQDYPLKLIAEMIGYQNTFAFSTAFKRYFGHNPSTFRKLL